MIDIFHHLSVSIDFSPLTNVLMTISEQDEGKIDDGDYFGEIRGDRHFGSVDIIGNVQKSFSNFVKTGQAWALLIGFIAGYMFRGFTSY